MAVPPLLILGVRRSGTTLLRVMLDRSSELAVPDESYFVPQLADRHHGRVDVDAFVEDLRRVPTLLEWNVPAEAVRARLREHPTAEEAIATVYEVYAERNGKRRWGDKTPMYMQHLGLLERTFPDARFVHLIRDGRDAALSFLAMPRGIVTETWAHPGSARSVACQWRTEVADARALGRRVGDARYLEVRYERFVRDPAAELQRICAFADLQFEPTMLDYVGASDAASKPHHRSLARPPTPGLRNWRTQMSSADIVAFERVAGDLLAELGYDVVTQDGHEAPSLRERVAIASYRARVTAWRVASRGLRRSPLWRHRHPLLA